MKRYYLLGFALAVVMTAAGPAMGAGEEGHPAVGTWVATADEPDLGILYDALLTVHSDGTLVLSQSTEDFESTEDFPEGCTHASTRQGVWEKDGPRTIIGTHIGFMYGLDPMTGECGSFSGYQRFRWRGEVRKDNPAIADAQLYADIYYANSDKDPLDPDSVPNMQFGPVTVTAHRVPIIAPPEPEE